MSNFGRMRMHKGCRRKPLGQCWNLNMNLCNSSNPTSSSTGLERRKNTGQLFLSFRSRMKSFRTGWNRLKGLLRKAWKGMIQLPQRVSRFRPLARQSPRTPAQPHQLPKDLCSQCQKPSLGARELFANMNPSATTTAHPPSQEKVPNDSTGFVPPPATAPSAAEHGAPGLVREPSASRKPNGHP